MAIGGRKWLAVVVASLGGMAATLAITAYVLSQLSLEDREDLGVRYHLGTPECLLLFAALAPMGMVAPAVQVYLACFAKTFKEAQSYMAFLIFAAITPGLLATFYPLGDRLWMRPVPILGQYTLAVDILGGKIPSPFLFVAAALVALAFAAVFVWLATRLFSSEKIILGR